MVHSYRPSPSPFLLRFFNPFTVEPLALVLYPAAWVTQYPKTVVLGVLEASLVAAPVRPVVKPLSLRRAVLQVALIHGSDLPFHRPFSLGFPVAEFTIVNIAVGKFQNTPAVFFVVLPFTIVDATVFIAPYPP